MRYHLSEVRKLVVHVVTLAVAILATILAVGPDLIPEKWLPIVLVVLGVASSYGLFKVPNQPAPGQARRPGVSEVATPVGDIPPDTPTRYDPGP